MKFTKDTLRRALRTAFQSAVAYVGAQLMAGVDFNDWRAWLPTVIAGAVGAALGAIMNLELDEEDVG